MPALPRIIIKLQLFYMIVIFSFQIKNWIIIIIIIGCQVSAQLFVTEEELRILGSQIVGEKSSKGHLSAASQVTLGCWCSAPVQALVPQLCHKALPRSSLPAIKLIYDTFTSYYLIIFGYDNYF